jgi:hypothetical protein
VSAATVLAELDRRGIPHTVRWESHRP